MATRKTDIGNLKNKKGDLRKKKRVIKKKDTELDNPLKLGTIFEPLLQELRKPFAWFFIVSGVVLATMMYETIGAIRHQEPLFSFLKTMLDDIGGIFSFEVSGYRYVRQLPALFYQLIVPFLFTWIVVAVTISRKKRKGNGFLFSAREHGFIWKGLRNWRRGILYLLLLLTPFIYFFASSAPFKRHYPVLPELRKRRQHHSQMKLPVHSAIRNQEIKALEKRLRLLMEAVDKKKKTRAQVRGSVLQLIDKIEEKRAFSFNWFFSVLSPFLLFELLRFLYMLAWEFFFRGFMIGWLRKKFAIYAVFIQMIPYVLLHSTRQGLELYSSIPIGVVLGMVAYHTKSIWPGFWLYYGVVFLFDFFAMFG